MQRSRNRVLNACQRCRKQKIKCSGNNPCQACHERGLRCDFGAQEKQIVISEKELFDLRNRLRQSERRNLSRQTEAASTHDRLQQLELPGTVERIIEAVENTTNQARLASEQDRFISIETSDKSTTSTNRGDSTQAEVPNLLVPEQPAYISESSGKLRHLGHSSNYAFTQQVLQLLQQDPPSNPSPEILLSSDGKIYKAESSRLTSLNSPDISRLPSKSIALHYLQCVRFRTQPLFYLFDEFEFNTHLNSFYRDPSVYSKSNLLWFTQYLVLMSLGKALDSSTQADVTSVPPVSEHFSRALERMPDMAFLCDDPTGAAELFCSVALYLQCIDHRRSAVVYIGQAVRMAQLDALHLDLQENVVGNVGVDRGRRVWWTVYALNQRLSSNIGLPNSISDSDITNPSPKLSDTDEDIAAFALHIKICRLFSVLISNVYGSSEALQKSFVSVTRTVLKTAAQIADDLKHHSKQYFGAISRVAAHLELAYHQCIIVACRPALFYLLKVQSTDWLQQQPPKICTSVAGVVQVCIDSAHQAVNTLSQLRQYDLLDTFLPFDLECAFSAAYALVIARRVCPRALPNEQSSQTAKEVIEFIANRGNAQASLRKLEVEELEDLLALHCQDHQQNENREMQNNNSFVAAPSEQMYFPLVGNLFFDEWYFDAGLSGNQIMNLADALDTEHFYGFA